MKDNNKNVIKIIKHILSDFTQFRKLCQVT